MQQREDQSPAEQAWKAFRFRGVYRSGSRFKARVRLSVQSSVLVHDCNAVCLFEVCDYVCTHVCVRGRRRLRTRTDTNARAHTSRLVSISAQVRKVYISTRVLMKKRVRVRKR